MNTASRYSQNLVKNNVTLVDVFVQVEQDLSTEVECYGPRPFANILSYHNIISSKQLELIHFLIDVLHSDEAAVVLMDIIAENVKNPATYQAFKVCLEKEQSLNYLYQKVIILG